MPLRYTITVQAKDEYNASKEGNFTVTLADDRNDNYAELERIRIVAKINAGESLFVNFELEDEVTLAIKGLGSSLESSGITDGVQDPFFDVYSSGGVSIASNDDWESGQFASILQEKGEVPSSNYEPADMLTLQQGSYTVVLGAWGSAGSVAIEIVNLYPDNAGKIVSVNTTGRVTVVGYLISR